MLCLGTTRWGDSESGRRDGVRAAGAVAQVPRLVVRLGRGYLGEAVAYVQDTVLLLDLSYFFLKACFASRHTSPSLKLLTLQDQPSASPALRCYSRGMLESRGSGCEQQGGSSLSMPRGRAPARGHAAAPEPPSPPRWHLCAAADDSEKSECLTPPAKPLSDEREISSNTNRVSIRNLVFTWPGTSRAARRRAPTHFWALAGFSGFSG